MKKILLLLLFVVTLCVALDAFAITVPVSTDLSPILGNCTESSCNVEPGF